MAVGCCPRAHVVVRHLGEFGRCMFYQKANMFWHSDSSFETVPSLCSILTARVVPPEGGATEFASTPGRPFPCPTWAAIALGGDCRRYPPANPDEAPFRYAPFAELMDAFRFSDETFNKVIRDYNTKDLAI